MLYSAIQDIAKIAALRTLTPTVSRVLAKTALALAVGAALFPLSALAPVDLRIALVIGNAA